MANQEEKKYKVRYEKPGGEMTTLSFDDEGEAKDFMAKHPKSFMIKNKKNEV
ncbi:hypothetical protein ACFL2U_01565 [Patescibacteria group bacterium]